MHNTLPHAAAKAIPLVSLMMSFAAASLQLETYTKTSDIQRRVRKTDSKLTRIQASSEQAALQANAAAASAKEVLQEVKNVKEQAGYSARDTGADGLHGLPNQKKALMQKEAWMQKQK
eukprot:3736118-Rhodomonas_salina.3